MRKNRIKERMPLMLAGFVLLCSFPVLEVGAAAPASSRIWGTTQVVDNQAFVIWNLDPSAEKDLKKGIDKYRIIDGAMVADQAYYRNRNLTALMLPGTVKEIGMFAFARSGIRHVELPDGLETIGMGAFYHCDSLEGVTLPDTLVHVEPMAFDKTLWVRNFYDKAEDSFLIEGGVLLAYKGQERQVEIPEGVRLIGPMALAGHEEIEKIILPDSVQSIEEGAFLDCRNLKEIVWNQNVETIRDRAFAGCGLEAVTLPPGIRQMGAFAFEQTAKVTLSGEAVETITETDMTYLSNLSYRPIPATDAGKRETRTAGATGGETMDQLRVLAPEGMEVSLEGLQRDYSLTVEEATVDERTEKAYFRSMGQELPEEVSSYTIQLREEMSNVTIRQLGKEGMTLRMTDPGRPVRTYTLDRNGQLEGLEAQKVGDKLVVKLNHLYGPLIVVGE